MAGNIVQIAIAANARPAVAAFDSAGDAAKRMGSDVETSARHMDDLGEKFGDANSKSSQLAGALGDVAGAFANSGDKAGILGKSVGNVAGTIESLSPFVMVAAGAFDILELAMNTTALASARSAVAMVGSRVAMAAGAVATGVMTAAQWALNVAMDANPIGLVVLAIAALVAIFVVAWNNSETFRKILTGGWDAIKGAAVASFGFVRDFVGGVFDDIAGFFDKLLGLPGKMAQIGIDIVHGIGQGIDNALDWVKGKVGALGNVLPGWLRKVLGISSPSKVFAQIGRYSVQGFAKGFQSMSAADIVDPLGRRLAATQLSGPTSAVSTLMRSTAATGAAQEVNHYTVNVPEGVSNPYLYGQKVANGLQAFKRGGGAIPS